MTWTLSEAREIKSIDDLDELGQQQIVVAGKRYDGAEHSAQDRLDGVDGDPEEGALFQPRIFKILDGDTHLYDVWSYMVDSGSIFVASTTDVAAEICQFGLECTNAELSAKLDPVLRSKRLVSG